MKTCCRCKETKALKDFARDRQRKDGRAWKCRACYKESYRRSTFKRTRERNWRELGIAITFEEYTELLVKQQDCCAICGIPSEESGKALAVDHCHETGRVRGLLCGRCNRMLGLADDRADYLRNLATYLEAL